MKIQENITKTFVQTLLEKCIYALNKDKFYNEN